MKSIKAISLTTIVALMAMASTASAETTALCSADESPCAAANLVTHIHETSVTKEKLLTSFLTIECDFLSLGDALSGLVENGSVIIHGKYTYLNCGACTITEENGPGESKVLKLGHETADTTGEHLSHMVCGSSLDCSYNGVGLKATVKGPLLAATQKNGESVIVKQTLNKEAGGFLCPEISKLDLTTTPLSPIYITS